MAIQGVRLATSNYLATAASTYFQPGRTLTIMCWARPGTLPPTSNYYTLLGTTTSAGVSGWGISIQGGAGSTAFWEMFFTNNGSAYDDFRFTNGVATGRWDHIAWVMRSDATEAGYLNGVQETLVQSANAGVYPAAASRTLQIKWGDATGNGSFDGAMAYVRIFDGELSGPEIRAEMFARRACNKRLHVIADYPLEMVGGTSSIVAPDIGPHGLHVTSVTGTVTWDRDPPLPKHLTRFSRQVRLFSVGAAGGGQSALLGVASETDTAVAFTRAKRRTLGVASETDTAIAATARKARALGLASETDTAAQVGMKLGLNVASETDVARPLGRAKARQAGVAAEVDSAVTLGRVKARALTVAAETDTAGTVARAHSRILGSSTETDAAGALTRRKVRILGSASELDTALPVGAVFGHVLGVATESDSANAFSGAGKRRTVGAAVEVDTAGAVTPPAVDVNGRPLVTYVSGPQVATAVAGPQRATNANGPQRATVVT